jgi:hypothetical protein
VETVIISSLQHNGNYISLLPNGSGTWNFPIDCVHVSSDDHNTDFISIYGTKRVAFCWKLFVLYEK